MIGILALQGDFAEHANTLKRLNEKYLLVRNPEDLTKISHLVIPGGESTAFGIIAEASGMIKPLKQFIAENKPVWGTCAGVIFLAKNIESAKKDGQITLDVLDITVQRNYFGRQIESFETSIQIPEISKNQIDVSFIRAPAITQIGSNVKILASIKHSNSVMPVAIRQNNILATTFHSELLETTELANYFLKI